MDARAPEPAPVRAMPTPESQSDELKAFMLVLHRALKMLVVYIEKRYIDKAA